MINSQRISMNASILVDPSRILDTLVNNLDGMVYRCKHDAEWTMLFVSHGCLELTGYTPEEVLANTYISYEEITHPDDRQRVRDEIERATAAGLRFSVHYRIITRTGETKWVHERGIGVLDETGEPVIEGFIEDETGNQETLEAMRNAEHYYRNLVENASVGIFQTSMDGHYLAANPALAKIYGYATPEDLIHALSDIGRQLYVNGDRRQEFRLQMQMHNEIVNFHSNSWGSPKLLMDCARNKS